jgi:TRAP-type C4-dicarboxylate transport system substrate-binding protein
MGVGRLHVGLLAIVLAGIATGGCGSGEEGTKAGASGGPVTLRMGVEGSPGRPEADQLVEFARQVEELSDGGIRVETVFRAVEEGADDFDQQVARMVAQGDLDVSIIPARAWDTEGVTSLNALNAPFLVTSDELVERIITGELAGEMLSGLTKAGVVGLALLPVGLRHPFAFGDPLVSADDYKGALIRAPRSEVAYALFEALGATADDLPGTAFDEAIADGSVAAADSSFGLAGSLGAPTVAIGNVTFFPRVNSLVVNADVFAGLDGDQRAILEKAASGTLLWALEAFPTEAEAAQAWCDSGGEIVLASDVELAELEQAAAPVYLDLERDAQTKSLIAAIRELKAGTSVSATASPSACEGEPGTGASSAASAQSFPEGVYRAEHTAEELAAAGMDPELAASYAGVQTITFEGGTYTDAGSGGPTVPPCLGSYSSSGSRIEIDFQVDCTGGMTATWSVDDGELRFTDAEGELIDETEIVRAVFGSEPYLQIEGNGSDADQP